MKINVEKLQSGGEMPLFSAYRPLPDIEEKPSTEVTQPGSTKASSESVLDEYNECNDKVKNAIEVPDYNSHLFRFPGGLAGGKYAEIKKEAKELLLQNNIVNVDWNALTGDAETNNLSVEFEMTRLTETMESKNSLVILMHDAAAKSVTADALPQIIAKLKEEGYEFKNFYDIIK